MRNTLYILLAAFLFSACVEEFDRQTVDLEVQVVFNAQFGSGIGAFIPVTLKHTQKDLKVSGVTDSHGYIKFQNLDPGFYFLFSSSKIDSETAQVLSDQNYGDSLILNANQLVALLESIKDTLTIVPSFKSKLIIREFYYSGSFTENDKLYYADQYLEIFNNSHEPQNINGLIISTHESTGSGPNAWAYIEDSVVVNLLWQIPVTFEDSILLPGTSIVIAQDAIDHKDDPNGNNLSPVNLSLADLEFYMDKDNKDLDSPAPNMNELFTMYRGSDVTFYVKFGGGLMLIKPDTRDIESYIRDHYIKKYSASGSSYKNAVLIPKPWILDAVDVLRDRNSEIFKRFTSDLDAGFTYNDESGSGTCVTRKLVSDVNGRKIYMDTNNSTNDFLNHQIPNPFLNE